MGVFRNSVSFSNSVRRWYRVMAALYVRWTCVVRALYVRWTCVRRCLEGGRQLRPRVTGPYLSG